VNFSVRSRIASSATWFNSSVTAPVTPSLTPSTNWAIVSLRQPRRLSERNQAFECRYEPSKRIVLTPPRQLQGRKPNDHLGVALKRDQRVGRADQNKTHSKIVGQILE